MSDPIFKAPITNPFGLASVGSYTHPVWVDIDGDGDLDAFIGEGDGNTRFFRNTGIASQAHFIAETSNFGLTNAGRYAKPSFADIDSDGDLDAFVGNADGDTQFFRNIGDANTAHFVAKASNFGLTNAGNHGTPTFADIDGDGDFDAFISHFDGDTQFFRNTGTASTAHFVAKANNFGLTDVGYHAALTLADMDGDGDLDALIGNSDGNLQFFRNTGTVSSPAFAAPETNPFGLSTVGGFARPFVGDIDGDGDSDVLVVNKEGNTTLFLNSKVAPTASHLNQTVSYTEDTQAAIANIVITDPDLDTFTAVVTLVDGNSAIGSLSANSGHGESYTAATGTWAVTGSLTTVNAALAALSFIPVANGFADTSARVSISDGVAPAISGTLNFNGIAVNDAPVLTEPAAIRYTDTIFNDHFATATGSLLATDIDNATLIYGIVGGVSHSNGTISKANHYGVLTVNSTTGAYTFTTHDAPIERLQANVYKGFTMTVSDGLLSDHRTVELSVIQRGMTESTGNDALTGNAANNKFNGLAGNDIIKGLAGADALQGSGGADTLIGGAGSDTLMGGIGNDRLTGGGGQDSFRFNTAIVANVDKITDFNVLKDTIQLDNAIFTQLASTGVLAATHFITGGAARDADDYLIYKAATGVLSYDADGNGAGLAVSIAVLGLHLALTPADFMVI